MNRFFRSAATSASLMIGLALCIPQAASAQEANSSTANPAYDLSRLTGICDFAYMRTRALAGTGYRYEYEKMMEEAAGVTPADDASTKKRKVQMLWRDNQSVFTCTASNFNLANGNLLKYSVSSRSYNFLNTALGKWELELNFIDPVDRRTLLDYLRRELEANAGNSDEDDLKNLYDASRKRGAKFCYELISAEHCEHPKEGTFLTNNDRFRSGNAASIASDTAIVEYNQRLRSERD